MRYVSSLVLLLPTLLFGCAAEQRTTGVAAREEAALPGVTAYYEQATRHERRAVRKPLRDQRAYAMKMVAQESAQLLSETSTWTTDARLTSLDAPQRSAADAAVADLQTALAGLEEAAQHRDAVAMRTQHAAALAAYARLTALAAVPESPN